MARLNKVATPAPTKPRQDRGAAARRPEILMLAKTVMAQVGYQAALGSAAKMLQSSLVDYLK